MPFPFYFWDNNRDQATRVKQIETGFPLAKNSSDFLSIFFSHINNHYLSTY